MKLSHELDITFCENINLTSILPFMYLQNDEVLRL